ncbi:MAG: DUF3833 domain-containing protein [Psychromonas sp.]|nr:DUF3833 domain-containing protein [Psychromonas sp.]
MKVLISIFICLFVTACSSQKLSDYDNTRPVFDVQNYFNGNLLAYGVVLDRSGKVTRRFTVKMIGSWSNNHGKLEEWFAFDDGEKMTRTWLINKQADGSYTGRADDIVGLAVGESNGIALHWDYQLELTVEGSAYRVTFDDWLYQVDNDVVINRSYIKKWGFTLGEVILVINKKANL